MTKKRNRKRVPAEITLFQLILLANEHGYRVSHQQAMAFLNEKESARQIWKQVMQTGWTSSPVACLPLHYPRVLEVPPSWQLLR
jgi:hypothetical protein